jgi:hypothetical protein
MRLFPADGVMWMVSMPSGIPAETVWPDVDWLEALAPTTVEPDEPWALPAIEAASHPEA